MNIKYFILGIGLFFSLLFQACQSEIEVKLPDYEPKLVVEGYIENGKPPRVMLTRSVPYFQYMDYNYLQENVLITDAGEGRPRKRRSDCAAGSYALPEPLTPVATLLPIPQRSWPRNVLYVVFQSLFSVDI